MNRFDNTNDESVLTKQFKTNDVLGCNNAKTTTAKQAMEKHQEASRRELDNSSTRMCYL